MTTQNMQKELTRSALLLPALLTALALVAGCATDRPRLTVERVQPTACPHVTPFSKDQLGRIADAEEVLPNDNPLTVVVDDWVKMRDQARSCRRTK